MKNYVKVNVAATVRVTHNCVMSVPKDLWEAVSEDEEWSSGVDQYIRENLCFDDPGAVYFDEYDVDVDDVVLQPPSEKPKK